MQNEQDPTDWDKCYREDKIPWDKAAAAPPLLEYLESNSVSGKILVPGCGLGHDVRALAAADPKAEIIGLDISATAINRAKDHPVVGAESYTQTNLFDLPSELQGSCDFVIEHTCLSGIPLECRPQYVDAFHTALKPGGKVVGIFFLKPWDDDETPMPPPHAVSTEELDAMFAERFELLHEWEPSQSYPEREGRELVRVLKKLI